MPERKFEFSRKWRDGCEESVVTVKQSHPDYDLTVMIEADEAIADKLGIRLGKKLRIEVEDGKLIIYGGDEDE